MSKASAPKMSILAQFLLQFLPFLPSRGAKIQKNHLYSCLTSSKQTYLSIKIKILEHRHIQWKGWCGVEGISPPKMAILAQFLIQFLPFLPSRGAKIQKNYLNSSLTSSKQTYKSIENKIPGRRHIQWKRRCDFKGISRKIDHFLPKYSNFAPLEALKLIKII